MAARIVKPDAWTILNETIIRVSLKQ